MLQTYIMCRLHGKDDLEELHDEQSCTYRTTKAANKQSFVSARRRNLNSVAHITFKKEKRVVCVRCGRGMIMPLYCKTYRA